MRDFSDSLKDPGRAELIFKHRSERVKRDRAKRYRGAMSLHRNEAIILKQEPIIGGTIQGRKGKEPSCETGLAAQ